LALSAALIWLRIQQELQATDFEKHVGVSAVHGRRQKIARVSIAADRSAA
jgi:hypothetical protein